MVGGRQEAKARVPRPRHRALLAEHNAREGFLEPGDFESLVRQLPEYLQDFTTFAYLSGWRRGEVQTLEWADVDKPAPGRVTLRREHSKNGEPRVLPLTPALAALIERRWEARQVKAQDGTVTLCPLVFHHQGRPIGDFRKARGSACRAAGFVRPKVDAQGRPVLDKKGQPVAVAAVLFHDLRRSCVRNLEKERVSQAVAMKITGHKTASVYRRYRIVDEADMREALARVETAMRRRGRPTARWWRSVRRGRRAMTSGLEALHDQSNRRSSRRCSGSLTSCWFTLRGRRQERRRASSRCGTCWSGKGS